MSDSEARIRTGSRGQYRWLISTEQYIGTLVRRCPEILLGRFIAVTSLDSGSPRLSERHERIGWRCRQGICYSQKLQTVDQLLDFQLHGEDSPGFDEWYTFTEPPDLGESLLGHPVLALQPGGTLVFVNYYNFVIDSSDLAVHRGLIDLFWQQLERIQPESYIADTSESLTFVTHNAGLFRLVLACLQSAPAEAASPAE